jgi:hypothetical protein
VSDEANKTEPDKKADALLQVFEKIQSSFEAWINQDGEVGVSLCVQGSGGAKRKVHFLLSSGQAKSWLGGFLIQNRMARGLPRLIEELRGFIEINAQLSNNKLKTYSRVAEWDEKIYINLMDDIGSVAEVSSDGWQIVSECPVKFLNPSSGLALPMPDREGSFDDLDLVLNVQNRQTRNMIASFLFAAICPNGPYPVLIINGQQGSAKSTMTRFLRMLVDPAKAPARSLSGSERDLVIAAQNNWVLAFDNLSKLSDDMSDALCRLATGSGFGVRKHYENAEEVIFEATRPIILNGIESVVSRQDLLSRGIVINLPTIPDDKKKTEEGLKRDFESIRPKIFGALLNAMSAYLKNKENVTASELPRMADFAVRVMAAEIALGWEAGEFLPYYMHSLESSARDASEGDIFVTAIRELVHGKQEWEGTATDLHKEILCRLPIGKEKFLSAPNKLPLERWKPILKLHEIELQQKRTATERKIIIINKNPGAFSFPKQIFEIEDLLKKKL